MIYFRTMTGNAYFAVYPSPVCVVPVLCDPKSPSEGYSFLSFSFPAHAPAAQDIRTVAARDFLRSDGVLVLFRFIKKASVAMVTSGREEQCELYETMCCIGILLSSFLCSTSP